LTSLRNKVGVLNLSLHAHVTLLDNFVDYWGAMIRVVLESTLASISAGKTSVKLNTAVIA
jgi:hypothetical protein